MRTIYLYLTVEEGGPFDAAYAFFIFHFFHLFLQLSPSGCSENGRDHMLLYSHILTKKKTKI